MIGTVFPVYFECNTGPKHDYSLTTPTTVKVFDHLIFIKIKGALSIMYNRNTYIYLCIKEDCTLKSLISRVQKINWPSIHKEIENRSWKNYLSTKLDPRRQFLPPRIGELHDSSLQVTSLSSNIDFTKNYMVLFFQYYKELLFQTMWIFRTI